MKKILICDDEADVVEALSQILELSIDNLQITTVTDSIDALIIITETKFDLILTDYKMPKLTGTELLNNMYTIHSSVNKQTPVFIVTGNARDIDSSQFEGKDVLLVEKPVQSAELIELITKKLSL